MLCMLSHSSEQWRGESEQENEWWWHSQCQPWFFRIKEKKPYLLGNSWQGKCFQLRKFFPNSKQVEIFHPKTKKANSWSSCPAWVDVNFPALSEKKITFLQLSALRKTVFLTWLITWLYIQFCHISVCPFEGFDRRYYHRHDRLGILDWAVIENLWK